MADLPAITGNELIKLLEKDDWKVMRKANHGVNMTKKFHDRNRVTVVPTSNKSLPRGTLMDILGKKQTTVGRNGLLKLIKKYGLK